MKHPFGFSTLAVHAGDPAPGPHPGAPVEAPLYLSSSFSFGDASSARAAFAGEIDASIYGRWGNPTTAALEAKLAALEGGAAAVATASGMAAISGTLLGLLESGDHVVAPRAMYAETARLLRERLPRLGIETTFVDGGSIAAYEAALRPNTRMIYAETPANPTLAITDLEALAALGRAHETWLVADNTFATPACQRPLSFGFDVSLHSMTKALCGHGDAIGGVIVSASAEVGRRLADCVVKGFGGVLAPFNAFLISRGVRTLALRASRANASALEIARWLSARAGVTAVHYPGLTDHPDHALAARQMTGFGALLSFEIEGGLEAGARVLDRVRCVTHAVSLGDVRSLITHPASTTASTMPERDRVAAGITAGLLRLSVGIEDPSDLIEDIDQAIASAIGAAR